jgi:DnaA N-terminal domain
MSGLAESGDQRWRQVLDEAARNVSRGCFDTWFPPLHFIALQGSTLQLVVPTETFRPVFLETNSAILCEAAARVIGSPVTLQVAVETPEQSAVGPGAAAAPFPVVRAAELETSTQRPRWLIERLSGRGNRGQSQVRQNHPGPRNGGRSGLRHSLPRSLCGPRHGPRDALRGRGLLGRAPGPPWKLLPASAISISSTSTCA